MGILWARIYKLGYVADEGEGYSAFVDYHAGEWHWVVKFWNEADSLVGVEAGKCATTEEAKQAALASITAHRQPPAGS